MKTSKFFSVMLIFAMLLATMPVVPALAATGPLCYVDMDATGGGNSGNSWGNAYTDLQSALTDSNCAEIWVAEGTYAPGTLRTDTFQLVSGVGVYGGFAGTETVRSERDPAANLTILSGDIDGDDDQNPITDLPTVIGNTNNSYHVVTGNGTDSTAILDGFTVTGGYADGNSGAGIYNNNGDPTLNNLVITGNYASGGGGAMINFGGSRPALTNVTFSNNAANSGGAIYNDLASHNLTNVTFHNNSANYGGAIYNNEASPILNYVTFSNNTATAYGGGIYNSIGSPSLTNVTFSGNSASDGGGIADTGGSESSMNNVTFHGNTATNNGGGAYLGSGSAAYNNVIFWGNTATNGAEMYNYSSFATPVIKDSVVEGGCPAGASCTNIITSDPLLGSLADNGGNTQTMALGAGSSAIDAGGVNAACATEDQRGVFRPQGSGCDIGAYEHLSGTYYAKPAATGTGNCDSWTNACTLELALKLVHSGDEVWVMSGTHVPTTDAADRTATFQLVTGVGVFGGFTGTETALNQSDPNANLTILSGDIDRDDSQNPITDLDTVTGNTTNSYHVVTGSGTSSTAILNGFTITGGYANGSSPNSYGAGMFSQEGSPNLVEITFIGNQATQGGGMFNEFQSSPSLTDVTFIGNTATTGWGGGMFNWSQSSPSLTNVTFDTNTAKDGGGMANGNSSSPSLTNVTFSGNTVSRKGGGLFNNNNSSPNLTNVTFSGNTGGMASELSSYPTLFNVILWGDTGSEFLNSDSASTISITDSIVQGGCPTGVNCLNVIDADPLLEPLADNGGYTQTMALGVGSPAIDAGGVNSSCVAEDQRGVIRPQGGGCEIGAFEYLHSGTFYVSTSGSGSCTSWADTCSLLTALSQVNSGDEIWVMAGTYFPGITRIDTFQLVNGVGIYGGFAGTETAREQRDFETNVTILSGDIGIPGDNSDNSGHVVVVDAVDSTAVLDGFTITAGNANAGGPYVYGGGMWANDCSPTIRNVIFDSNTAQNGGGGLATFYCSPDLFNVTFVGNTSPGGMGGGMFGQQTSNPTLTNVTFENNSAGAGGGLLLNYQTNANLEGVLFTGNTAEYGGGMYVGGSDPGLSNVTFTENTATFNGGGMWNETGTLAEINNVTFYSNHASTGGGMYSQTGSGYPHVTNSIFWGNTATSSAPQIFNDAATTPLLNDSVIEGGCPYNGNCNNIILNDPLLGTLGDYGGYTLTIPLLAGSPAIDAGNGTTCASTDQRGMTRPQGSGCDIGAYEYVDTTAPVVSSITLASTNPTSAPSVGFTVTFSEAVSGVDASDFSLNTTGGISGASVSSVTATVDPAVYTVTVDTGNGSGTLRLDLIDDDSILDASLNSLGGTGAGNGDYTSGETYTINKGPSVLSIERFNYDPTTLANVFFVVTFSEEVTGVNAPDFTLTTTGTLAGAGVLSVTGTGATRTVKVSTGTGSGTLRLDLVDDDSILNTNLIPLGGSGTGNGDFTDGQFYNVRPPTVVSILRLNTATTKLDTVFYSVTFSEAVTGVNSADFSLTTDGTLAGANVMSVTGSGATRTVRVNTGTGDGTLRLNLVDDDSIQGAVMPLGGVGTGNGDYPYGQIYTVDKTPPMVVSVERINWDPSGLPAVYFLVTFSEPVVGVNKGDFVLTTTGAVTGAVVNRVSGSGATRTVKVLTGTGDGTIRLDILDDDGILDYAYNRLGGEGLDNGAFNSGEAYTIFKP